MSATPTLSVIVTCQFPGTRHPYVLTSLWDQRAGDAEIILVNRDATGGSHDWIRASRDKLAHLVSAPDASQYDAMNRGLSAATGEWVLFLGPEDRLVGDMILSEALHWMKTTEAGVAIGEVASDSGRIFKFRSRVNPRARHLAHPAGTFYRRTLFAENGEFNPSFGLLADYEYHLRLWKNGVRFKPLPLRIAACEVGYEREISRWDSSRAEMRARRSFFSARRCLVPNAWTILRWVSGKARRMVSK